MEKPDVEETHAHVVYQDRTYSMTDLLSHSKANKIIHSIRIERLGMSYRAVSDEEREEQAAARESFNHEPIILISRLVKRKLRFAVLDGRFRLQQAQLFGFRYIDAFILTEEELEKFLRVM